MPEQRPLPEGYVYWRDTLAKRTDISPADRLRAFHAARAAEEVEQNRDSR